MVVGVGTSPVIETQELGGDPAHNVPGQMKRGKEQARHHLLQCRLRKSEFDVGVAESPPHGCQVLESVFHCFSVIICFECMFL